MADRSFRILCFYTAVIAIIGAGLGWNLHKMKTQYVASQEQRP